MAKSSQAVLSASLLAASAAIEWTDMKRLFSDRASHTRVSLQTYSATMLAWSSLPCMSEQPLISSKLPINGAAHEYKC